MKQKVFFYILIILVSSKMIISKPSSTSDDSCGLSCLRTVYKASRHDTGGTQQVEPLVRSSASDYSSDGRTKKKMEFPAINHSGLSLKALVDQEKGSQETLARGSSDDNSQLTVSRSILRFQSNDFIESSDLTDAYIAIQPQATN